MALEDEREEIKVVRKKNANNIRDLQRQLQQSKRYDSMSCVCVCVWLARGDAFTSCPILGINAILVD